jgi:Flp pilus assembly protein CpaB
VSQSCWHRGVNSPLVSISAAPEGGAAHSVITSADVVPSIRVLSVDQAISQMTSATANGQMTLVANLEPSDMTAASAVAAMTTLLATDARKPPFARPGPDLPAG